jgi:hypothetical protein
MATREPISQHARIFGGDSLYEVLAAVAKVKGTFHGSALADELGRSPAQVQRELRKLLALGAIVEQKAPGMRRPMARANGKLARNLFSLPALIEARLGPYRLPREGEADGD